LILPFVTPDARWRPSGLKATLVTAAHACAFQ
jgi:hypothetical protein